MADVNTSQNRLKKEAIKAELLEKVEKSQGMVFANYQGLTHQQLEGLKKGLKKVDAEFVAAKNTLLLRALEGKIDVKAEKDKFVQPTAALFIYGDIVEPLKLLSKTIKDFKLPTIKFGFIEGNMVTDKEVVKIATLPPLPVLRAQLLGQMNAPIQGLHRALSWNMTSLVMTLNAIKDKKSV
ncbi:MAG: 50S ribosomal protein L10 [Candidatus Levybacteria bacterium]|nr:50S ribosomal protein L10 [Candidatus Levybacteria bacterium]